MCRATVRWRNDTWEHGIRIYISWAYNSLIERQITSLLAEVALLVPISNGTLSNFNTLLPTILVTTSATFGCDDVAAAGPASRPLWAGSHPTSPAGSLGAARLCGRLRPRWSSCFAPLDSVVLWKPTFLNSLRKINSIAQIKSKIKSDCWFYDWFNVLPFTLQSILEHVIPAIEGVEDLDVEQENSIGMLLLLGRLFCWHCYFWNQ